MSISWNAKSRALLWMIFCGLLILAVVAWQLWRGPSVNAYQVKSTPLTQVVVATGRIISTSRVQVGSEITGVITERRVQEGDTVTVGDILLTLRSEEIAAKVREAEAALEQLQNARRPQAQAALRQTESQLLQASREAQRRRELFLSQSISREVKEQSEHLENTARANAEQARLLASSLAEGASEESILTERLSAAKAAFEKSYIRSQINGTVLTRNVEPGDLVQPGRVLLEIAKNGETEVLVPLDERNLGVLRLGQTAICVTDAYPGKTFHAKVSFIAPTVDTQRGTVDIRLTVNPVPSILRQDMTVTVNIETGKVENSLAVPNDAIHRQRGDTAELLIVKDHRVRTVNVTLGLRGLVMTEITSGLDVDDWVIAASTDKTSAASSLKDGMRVRIKPFALPGTDTNYAIESNKTNSKATPVKFN